MIAKCADEQKARQLFTDTSHRLPPTAEMRVFGKTILLAFDDDEQRIMWADEFERQCKSVGVHSEDDPIPFSLVCIAPNESVAEQIEQSVLAYVDAGSTADALIPPWSPEQSLTAEHVRARATILKLQNRQMEPDETDIARMMELSRELVTAQRRGDQKRVEDIVAQMQAAREEATEHHIQWVREQDDVDLELIDIFTRRPAIPQRDNDEAAIDVDSIEFPEFRNATERWKADLAARMGQVPLVDGKPAPGSVRYSSSWGSVSRAGLLLRFDGLTFQRHVDGIPAFADWLCSKDCIDVKYQLASPENMFDELDLEEE